MHWRTLSAVVILGLIGAAILHRIYLQQGKISTPSGLSQPGMTSEEPAFPLKDHLALAVLTLMIMQVPSQTDRTQYVVHRVTLVGSTSGVTDKELRRACISIEEGKLYTTAALDKTIKAIYKLGAFRKVTRADCTVTRSRVYPGTVDITIMLKPRTPPKDRPDSPPVRAPLL
jgi:hypothetical protein